MGKHWGKALNGIANVVEQEKWPCSAQLIREAAEEIERLRERCYPDAVVMIDGVGHYVNETVKAEIERLRDAIERIEQLDERMAPITNMVRAKEIAREALNKGEDK